MKDLVIIGAGGFGREVAWLVDRINNVKKTWNLIGFIDDNEAIINKSFNGNKIIGNIEWLKYQEKEIYVVCAIAKTKIRKKIINDLINYNHIKYATLVDPTVIYSNTVNIGAGSIICTSSIITTNIKIGNHVIINPNCTIGHDAIINDICTLYPSVNVSGNTVIGKCVELGTGTQVIQLLTIGENSIIGAGAVVSKNIPNNCVAVGIPAKPIRFFE